jgi:hypothetical protein
MKTIGMIGAQLIHTYAYGMHLKKPDLGAARKGTTVPAWQLKMMEDAPDTEPIGGATLTHVAGGLEGVPEDMAATFDLTVCGTVDEAIEACDLVMVMDEMVDSRPVLIRKALEAGRHVFADKVPSLKRSVTEELAALAEARGVGLAAWSQQGYCPEYDTIREMPSGGVAHVGFRLTREILGKYAIHLISSVQGCFPGPYAEAQVLGDGDPCLLHMVSSDGTKIIAGAGEDYPAGLSRVDYCVNGKAALVETRDRVGAFRRAAQDVIGLLEGKTPRLTVADTIEASRLIELIS